MKTTRADTRVLIVGGGLGGLSAGIHLRLAGFRVTLLEAGERVGGRANLIERDGFRFDTGPSLLNYPWVFEQMFEAAGRRHAHRPPLRAHRLRADREVRALSAAASGARLSSGTASPRLRRAALAAAVSLFALLWVGGVLSRWVGQAREGDGLLASLFLTTAGLIVVSGERTWRGAARLAAVALAGFAVEAAGVRFGVPFGVYSYTGILRPQLSGVPAVMGFAWMALAAFACDFAWRLRLPPWVAILCAALLTTASDLVIDPVAATRLGHWSWARGGTYYGIPFSNFAGWFVTALLVCPVLGVRGRPNLWPPS